MEGAFEARSGQAGRLCGRRPGAVHRDRQAGGALQRHGRHRERAASGNLAGAARRWPGRRLGAAEFDGFRHGYAGTIYKGQGKTLDHTYLYHTGHWRSAASHVALTRQRESAQVFVAGETARDTSALARQMARGDNKSASLAWATRGNVTGAAGRAGQGAAGEREVGYGSSPSRCGPQTSIVSGRTQDLLASGAFLRAPARLAANVRKRASAATARRGRRSDSDRRAHGAAAGGIRAGSAFFDPGRVATPRIDGVAHVAFDNPYSLRPCGILISWLT